MFVPPLACPFQKGEGEQHGRHAHYPSVVHVDPLTALSRDGPRPYGLIDRFCGLVYTRVAGGDSRGVLRRA